MGGPACSKQGNSNSFVLSSLFYVKHLIATFFSLHLGNTVIFGLAMSHRSYVVWAYCVHVLGLYITKTVASKELLNWETSHIFFSLLYQIICRLGPSPSLPKPIMDAFHGQTLFSPVSEPAWTKTERVVSCSCHQLSDLESFCNSIFADTPIHFNFPLKIVFPLQPFFFPDWALWYSVPWQEIETSWPF